MKSAILYARVSTDEQAEKGTSLDSQLEACRKYAAGRGMEVIKEFKDDFTGSRIDRPGLQELINMVERRAADVVITYSSDRWARSVRVVLDLRDILTESGVELHYVLGGKVEFSPEGVIMDNTFSNFNEYWKMKIIEVTSRGKNKKAENGNMVMTGQAPYGYHRIGERNTATLEIDEREAIVVQKIFQWYTTGNGTGTPQSLRSIAMRLNDAENPEPTPDHRNYQAACWLPPTILGIIKNELYAGVTYYGKTRIIKKKRIKQPRDTWTPIQVPDLAIVDRATFDMAQKRRLYNQQMARRNRKHEYLLSGFIFCSRCHYAMAGQFCTKPTGKSFYYRCNSHWARQKHEACQSEHKTIATSKADRLVWEWLESLWEDEEKFDRGIMGLAERNRAKLEPMQKQLDRLQSLIDRQDQRARRFMSELGDIDDPELKAITKVNAREAITLRDQMKEEAQELDDAINSEVIKPEVVENLRELVATLREGRRVLNVEGKRIIMERLALRVEFRADDTGRWLDVSCGLHPEVIGLRLSW